MLTCRLEGVCPAPVTLSHEAVVVGVKLRPAALLVTAKTMGEGAGWSCVRVNDNDVGEGTRFGAADTCKVTGIMNGLLPASGAFTITLP
jgi:hypothetical protein